MLYYTTLHYTTLHHAIVYYTVLHIAGKDAAAPVVRGGRAGDGVRLAHEDVYINTYNTTNDHTYDNIYIYIYIYALLYYNTSRLRGPPTARGSLAAAASRRRSSATKGNERTI